MAKCKYCKAKLNAPFRYFSRGLYKYCSGQCFYKSMGKELRIEDKEDSTATSKARFQAQTDNSLLLSKGTEQVVCKSDRDSKYLSYVRDRKCCVCEAIEENHAHHMETGGMGTKGSDYSCIPLCSEHHTSGSKAIHQIGSESFAKEFHLDLKEVQIQLLREYIRKLYEQKS